MYLPDDNEGKGAAVVCQAHRVSRHSLNTQSWQTETGKAESCTWVVCKKLHCLTHTWVHGGHRTEWLGWAKEVLKKHGSKKNTGFISLNMKLALTCRQMWIPLIYLIMGCEHKYYFMRAVLWVHTMWLYLENGACPCEAGDSTGTYLSWKAAVVCERDIGLS